MGLNDLQRVDDAAPVDTLCAFIGRHHAYSERDIRALVLTMWTVIEGLDIPDAVQIVVTVLDFAAAFGERDPSRVADRIMATISPAPLRFPIEKPAPE